VHTYAVTVTWTGNLGDGTRSYRGYRRDHTVEADGRPAIPASSDPVFRGDPARWNPEQLLVAAVSQCHMLWYLHLCADAGVVVLEYRDEASGSCRIHRDGSGEFTEVTLRPQVVVEDPATTERALALHADVGALCQIARSVAFPVRHEPSVSPAPPSP
jgi:organic hydroperoxide reductase OsmC/OhrA